MTEKKLETSSELRIKNINFCFRYSIVSKPLVVDGIAKSHALSLAYDKVSLSELDPPLVLQEFLNHGMEVKSSSFVIQTSVT